MIFIEQMLTRLRWIWHATTRPTRCRGGLGSASLVSISKRSFLEGMRWRRGEDGSIQYDQVDMGMQVVWPTTILDTRYLDRDPEW